jgi:hypothetical protein
LKTFQQLELSLLQKHGYTLDLLSLTANPQNLSANPQRPDALVVAKTVQSEGGVKNHEVKGQKALGRIRTLDLRFTNGAYTISTDFEKFREYLLRERKKRTVGHILPYARRYEHILQTGDASELLALSQRNKHHAMRVLALLGKFHGRYDVWKQIKEKYDLKWSNADDLSVFNAMMDVKNNYSAMLRWLKDTCMELPPSYRNILIFDALVGLRPEEACQSVSLLKRDRTNYLKEKNEFAILEHYKYPQLFLRRTKKCYISVVNKKVLEIIERCGDHNYNAIYMQLKHRKIPVRFEFCRKIFGTYLRQQGFAAELVDLLEGRIGKSVFARHYFRPDIDEQLSKVERCLEPLYYEVLEG